MGKTINLGVSIIICCHNSANRLKPTLEHIAKQKVEDAVKWELIVVNNNSTDDTTAVAQKYIYEILKTIDCNIVDQPKPGLSFAREKGIEEAKYEYLLFCDDDNWLSEHYIQTVFDTMNSNHAIGALGGCGIPEFEAEPEKWIKENAGIFATGIQANTDGELTQSHHVYGAGCTYRKSAILRLKKSGFQYQLSGRKGNKMMAGEDHELCNALHLSGYEIWYDHRLTFKHFIPKERGSTRVVKKMLKGFAECNVILKAYQVTIAKGKKTHFKKSWLWVFVNLLISSIKSVVLKKASFICLYSNLFTLFYFVIYCRKYSKTIHILTKANWIA